TLKRRLEEGREKLRARLARQGIALPAALGALGLWHQEVGAAPPQLLERVASFAVSGGNEAALSARATLVANAILESMRLQRLKLLAAFTLLLCLAGAGTGLAYHWLGTPASTTPAVLPVVIVPPRPVDLYGDELPPGAVGRLGTRRFWVGSDAAYLAFTPDGSQILATGTTPVSFDVASGKRSLLFDRLPSGVTRVVFAPDGKVAAVSCVQRFGRDGTALTGGRLALFEVGSGKLLHELRPLDDDSPIYVAIAFAPGGDKLAAATNRHALEIFDVASGRRSHTLELAPLKPSPFGLRRHFQARPSWVMDLSFSASGQRIAVAGPDAHARVFAAETGQLVRDIATVQPELAVLSSDEKSLRTFSTDGFIRVWDVASGREEAAARTGVPFQFQSASRSGDGRTLALLDTYKTPIRLIDFETGKLRGEASGANGSCQAVFSADGKILASSADFEIHVRLWDAATGAAIEPRPSHTRTILEAAFAPDGDTIATTAENSDPMARIWDSRTTRELHRIPLAHGVHSLCYTPDSKQLILGEPARSCSVWDVQSGKLVRRIEGPFGAFRWVDVSPDGTTLVHGGGTQPIRFLDLATGAERDWQIPASGWRGLHQGGGRLLSLSEKTGAVHVWDLQTQREVRVLPKPSRSVAVDLSRDGRLLAVIGERPGPEGNLPELLVRVHDVDTGAELFALPAGLGFVGGLAFSPDGKLIAVAGWPGPIRVWNVATGQEVFTFRGHELGVIALSFAADGQRLASCGRDASVLIWDVAAPSR
ncbi:MAG: WD40 repeat domain-containing protein, partial [Gemmataceae bacterium]